MNITAKQCGALLLLLGGWSGGAFAYRRRDAALRHRKDTTEFPLHWALPAGEGQMVRLEDIARCPSDGDGTDDVLGLLAVFQLLVTLLWEQLAADGLPATKGKGRERRVPSVG